VIYEMATGRLPFTGASTGETVTNILEKDQVPITKLSPQRSKELERIVATLLSKQADGRYQSAAELQRDLSPLRDHSRSSPLGRILARLRQK